MGPIMPPLLGSSALLSALQAQYQQLGIAGSSLSQQLAAHTRQAFLPGAFMSVTVTNSGSGFNTHQNIMPTGAITSSTSSATTVYGTAGNNLSAVFWPSIDTSPYETPDWLKAMHTTIDTLHAKGI